MIITYVVVGNNIGDEGGECIGTALKTNSSLQELNMGCKRKNIVVLIDGIENVINGGEFDINYIYCFIRVWDQGEGGKKNRRRLGLKLILEDIEPIWSIITITKQ